MALIHRVRKPEICCVIRGYGTQRYQQNHYETLNVSADASQKDIRRAFIKLSKKLHPDTSGKHSHADFIRLNEAYSILSKENTKRQYDRDLKYNQYTHTHGYAQNMQYRSPWEYEVRTAGGPWPPPNQNPRAPFGLGIALLFFLMGVVHFIFMLHSLRIKKHALSRNARLAREYQHIRDMERSK